MTAERVAVVGWLCLAMAMVASPRQKIEAPISDSFPSVIEIARQSDRRAGGAPSSMQPHALMMFWCGVFLHTDSCQAFLLGVLPCNQETIICPNRTDKNF